MRSPDLPPNRSLDDRPDPPGGADGRARSPAELLDNLRLRLSQLPENHPSAFRDASDVRRESGGSRGDSRGDRCGDSDTSPDSARDSPHGAPGSHGPQGWPGWAERPGWTEWPGWAEWPGRAERPGRAEPDRLDDERWPDVPAYADGMWQPRSADDSRGSPEAAAGPGQGDGPAHGGASLADLIRAIRETGDLLAGSIGDGMAGDIEALQAGTHSDPYRPWFMSGDTGVPWFAGGDAYWPDPGPVA